MGPVGGAGAVRARHPDSMPEGADAWLEARGQRQLCEWTARWGGPRFAVFWWWCVVTSPLVWALARQGVKRMREAERDYLRSVTAAGRWSAYYRGMAAGRAAQRLCEFIQSLPVRWGVG